MKFMIISDIHGSKHYLQKVINIYKANNFDKLIILGDFLYHGPRNPIPTGYSPKDCIPLLNELTNDIIAVRGNCDSEVDQMVLDFDIMDDYKILSLKDRNVFLTHGHLYNKDQLPSLNKGDLLIHGHSHVLSTHKYKDVFILNPGSITLPKQDKPHTYGVLDDVSFVVYQLDGSLYESVIF